MTMQFFSCVPKKVKDYVITLDLDSKLEKLDKEINNDDYDDELEKYHSKINNKKIESKESTEDKESVYTLDKKIKVYRELKRTKGKYKENYQD